MDRNEEYEALVEEHEIESAQLLRPDGTREPVFLTVLKQGESNVRIHVHPTDKSKALQIVVDQERLLKRVRDPQDGS